MAGSKNVLAAWHFSSLKIFTLNNEKVDKHLLINMLIKKWKSKTSFHISICVLKFTLYMLKCTTCLENFILNTQPIRVYRYWFVVKTLWSSRFHCNIWILVSLSLFLFLSLSPVDFLFPLCVCEWDLRPLSLCQSHSLTHIPRRHTIDIWQIALCVCVRAYVCVLGY